MILSRFNGKALLLGLLLGGAWATAARAQTPDAIHGTPAPQGPGTQMREPDTASRWLHATHVFDGVSMHDDGWVLVRGRHIVTAVYGQKPSTGGTPILDFPGCTLLPGLIEGHSHLFLHPYNEVSWDDQVTKESRAERTARAVTHAEATLMAGFTTVRDLGTEGCWYDDVGLKHAIEKGVIPGPRMLCATRAIVATGSYGVKSESSDLDLTQGRRRGRWRGSAGDARSPRPDRPWRGCHQSYMPTIAGDPMTKPNRHLPLKN